ncbi:MAG TPA: PP2C family protein-serine/threonine phosphatase [Ignavibacteriaceae bacterium]|nr:PP2C family protein-serine/threonine phosphatase [Ignavibacteriaceae bacterium]
MKHTDENTKNTSASPVNQEIKISSKPSAEINPKNDPSAPERFKRNLTALVEFSRIINSSLELDFILNNILLTCMGKFFATKGLIALKKEGRLTLTAVKGISDELKKSFPNISFQSPGSKGNNYEKNLTEEFFKEKPLNLFLQTCGIVKIERICSSTDCLGFIGLGEKLNKIPYTDEDIEFLRTILNISATAVQNSLTINELTRVNRVLDSRIQRLNALFELSKEFGLVSEGSRVAKLLVYSVIGQFLVSKFAVVTFEGEGINILESKIPEEILLGALNQYNYTEIFNPVRKKDIEENFKELDRLNIELIVPMQMQGEIKGLILLGKRINNSDYSDADIEFIFSVGSLAIISLENRRLFIEALEKQKLEEELEIARDIQRNLLPHSIPEFENFEIAAMNLSSKQVGGDYYDIVRLAEESFCIAIADVSGKGVPAALLMANLQAFIKTTCKHGMRLDEATALINDLISENITDGKFITFFWGLLDGNAKTITYVNAGHNHPLLIRSGKVTKLDKGGMILGVMKTMIPYSVETIQLQSNDTIVLYTDGISEAMNDKGEEFSEERLEKLAVNSAPNSAQDILVKIQKEVQYFAAGTAQSDDLTLLVLKVK